MAMSSPVSVRKYTKLGPVLPLVMTWLCNPFYLCSRHGKYFNDLTLTEVSSLSTRIPCNLTLIQWPLLKEEEEVQGDKKIVLFELDLTFHHFLLAISGWDIIITIIIIFIFLYLLLFFFFMRNPIEQDGCTSRACEIFG